MRKKLRSELKIINLLMFGSINQSIKPGLRKTQVNLDKPEWNQEQDLPDATRLLLHRSNHEE